MEQANKVNQTNGTKGNRLFDKPDLVSKHKPSKLGLSDPRRTKIKLMLSHPKKSVQPSTVELWELEREKKKWEDMGFSVTVIN